MEDEKLWWSWSVGGRDEQMNDSIEIYRQGWNDSLDQDLYPSVFKLNITTNTTNNLTTSSTNLTTSDKDLIITLVTATILILIILITILDKNKIDLENRENRKVRMNPRIKSAKIKYSVNLDDSDEAPEMDSKKDKNVLQTIDLTVNHIGNVQNFSGPVGPLNPHLTGANPPPTGSTKFVGVVKQPNGTYELSSRPVVGANIAPIRSSAIGNSSPVVGDNLPPIFNANQANPKHVGVVNQQNKTVNLSSSPLAGSNFSLSQLSPSLVLTNISPISINANKTSPKYVRIVNQPDGTVKLCSPPVANPSPISSSADKISPKFVRVINQPDGTVKLCSPPLVGANLTPTSSNPNQNSPKIDVDQPNRIGICSSPLPGANPSSSNDNQPKFTFRKPKSVILPFKNSALPKKLVIAKSERKDEDEFPVFNRTKLSAAIKTGLTSKFKVNSPMMSPTLRIKPDPFIKDEPMRKNSDKNLSNSMSSSSIDSSFGLNNTSLNASAFSLNSSSQSSNDSINISNDDSDEDAEEATNNVGANHNSNINNYDTEEDDDDDEEEEDEEDDRDSYYGDLNYSCNMSITSDMYNNREYIQSRDASLADDAIEDSDEEDYEEKKKQIIEDIKKVESNINRTKHLLRRGNLSRLPDKGNRLKNMLKNELENLRELKKKLKDVMSRPMSRPWEPTRQLTLSRLAGLHDSLQTRPTEDTLAENPIGLETKLMPHQRHALSWLYWRENQKPAGGILADDMGLGKTLTMISLIVATKEDDGMFDSDDSDDEFEYKHRNRNNPDDQLKGGTLIIAPASILSQWKDEVEHHCRPNFLRVKIHHGESRTKNPYNLLRYDIVITTYHILSREFADKEKKEALLTMIKWKRVILDEAHTIRNSSSKFCNSVCDLMAEKRWALTGTPIQNKESDLYSLLKYLKCQPFDDRSVWRNIMRDKEGGHQRIATLMKSLMLRRTKEELQKKGLTDPLPEKKNEVIMIELNQQERSVYEKLLSHSQSLFQQFLASLEQKKIEREFGIYGGICNPSTSRANPVFNRNDITVDQLKLLSKTVPQLKNLKMMMILVLILRLRQMCCHPSLINAELESNELEEWGFSRDEMKKSNPSIFKDIIDDSLNINNPLFDGDKKSSKIQAIVDKVDSILNTSDKIIIVSQWTGYLKIISNFLNKIPGATYEFFTGETVIKERQSIVDNFNNEEHPKILLLSLCAGGVGLNLVGANHLFLVDIHWNPQLEQQAQDRIYRFGQNKSVFVYKFLTNNTIEENVKQLQDHKLQIASNILDNGKFTGNRLTLGEIKKLFGL